MCVERGRESKAAKWSLGNVPVLLLLPHLVFGCLHFGCGRSIKHDYERLWQDASELLEAN